MLGTGLTGPAALRPLTAASTTALLGQSGQCPTSTRFMRQTNKQTKGQCDCVKSFLRWGLIKSTKFTLHRSISEQFNCCRQASTQSPPLRYVYCFTYFNVSSHRKNYIRGDAMVQIADVAIIYLYIQHYFTIINGSMKILL